jgi:preprotein translocase subunit SecF
MIDFVGKRRWFFLISAILIIFGIISLAVFGLKWGVDFSSGTAITLQFERKVELAELRQQLADLGYDSATIQAAGEEEFFIRLREVTTEEYAQLKEGLAAGLGNNITDSSVFTVSPIIAAATVRNTGIAVIIASIGILLYVTWAFRKMPKPFRWGTCAIMALFHDLLIVIAVFSILGWAAGMEVDALFVTGVLAVAGVSVNNIVVVFDRIRENSKRGVSGDFELWHHGIGGPFYEHGPSYALCNSGALSAWRSDYPQLDIGAPRGYYHRDLFFFMYCWSTVGGLGQG